MREKSVGDLGRNFTGESLPVSSLRDRDPNRSSDIAESYIRT